MEKTLKAQQEQGGEVRQEQVAKKQKEYKLIGMQRKVPGHTLFEFNKKTKEVRPAQVTREAALTIKGKPTFRTKTDIHEDCFYVQALNKQNAIKKLRKIGFEL